MKNLKGPIGNFFSWNQSVVLALYFLYVLVSFSWMSWLVPLSLVHNAQHKHLSPAGFCFYFVLCCPSLLLTLHGPLSLSSLFVSFACAVQHTHTPQTSMPPVGFLCVLLYSVSIVLHFAFFWLHLQHMRQTSLPPPLPRRDSNSQSQQAIGSRPSP
jgi:hypothetical protein